MEINYEKSKLWFSPFIPKNKKATISNLLQINNTSDLGSYIGYPLKPTYSPTNFNYIIHKLRQKLQWWKMHLISFAGGTQLISGTMNQISNYHMKVFNLPPKIHNQIDKLNRNFLWGYSETTKKLHFIKWENITKAKRHGGLGLKNSCHMNAAYMVKLIWETSTNKQKPWVIFLKLKYK